jgi:hypothetical protein
MVCLERDHNVSVGRSRYTAVVVAQINPGRRQAYVIDDALQFLGWDPLSDHGFHLIDEFGRFFDARSRDSPDVQLK